MYRGPTGYSLNINTPARTRPARGCDQQLEQPMFTTREMHKLSASIFSLFAFSDLLLVRPLVLLIATSLVVSIDTRSVRRTINVGDTVNWQHCHWRQSNAAGARAVDLSLVISDVLLSKYRNVRIFLELPYPTKCACAVTHIRPKV